MKNEFDEISFTYWDNNKIRVGSSKSYMCNHNGNIYGDDQTFDDIEYVFKNKGKEIVITGDGKGPKRAYFQFVEYVCNMSKITFNNFLNNSAEKFRIYDEESVKRFTLQKRNSTRIKDDSCTVVVNGEKYYVANNLKVCEYFNSAASNIDPKQKGDWFIRIKCEPRMKNQIDKEYDETETVENYVNNYRITEKNSDKCNKMHRQVNGRKKTCIVSIDFEDLNKKKKEIGTIGESMVLSYEKKKLEDQGRKDLAEKIEHTATIKGDGYGYDIKSFDSDGNPIYIEVKSTKHNKKAGFYITKNEKDVANNMYDEGKRYIVYRIFNLNVIKGTADLIMYKPPFDETHYEMTASNWKIDIK